MARKLACGVVLSVFALGACAGHWYEAVPPSSGARDLPAAQPEALAGSDEEVVCTTEKPTGSHISKRVCRSPAVIAAERAEAEAFAKRINTPRPTPR
jgi:hypothetical protein